MKWYAWLILITLLISWSLYSPQRDHEQNKLAEIRTWALDQAVWPQLSQRETDPLIAVKEVYSVEQSQLSLKAYLLVPCESLCGQTEACARHCQTLMIDWGGKSPQARLMVEGYDLKTRSSLGRLVLDQVSPIELRYWSRRHLLISLIQTMSSEEKTLLLIKLIPKDKLQSSPPTKERRQREAHQEEHEQQLQLSSYDSLSLGPYHGHESPLEGSVSFRDLDGDDQVDLIAPLEYLVHLKPLQLFVPTPYRLTAQGIKQAPELINVIPPSNDQLREWILAIRGENETEPTISRAKRLFSFGLLLCLKGEFDKADQLIRFAYPQYPPVLHLWDQLRAHLALNQNEERGSNGLHSTPPDPYSVLDQ